MSAAALFTLLEIGSGRNHHVRSDPRRSRVYPDQPTTLRRVTCDGCYWHQSAVATTRVLYAGKSGGATRPGHLGRASGTEISGRTRRGLFSIARLRAGDLERRRVARTRRHHICTFVRPCPVAVYSTAGGSPRVLPALPAVCSESRAPMPSRTRSAIVAASRSSASGYCVPMVDHQI
jgi:hypothetical protein